MHALARKLSLQHISKMSNIKFKRIIFSIPLLVACSANNSYYRFDGRLSLTLVDDNRYTIVESKQEVNPKNNHIFYVKKGEKASFVLAVNYGYQLLSTSVSNSNIIYLGDYKYSLSINDIKYSIRVSLIFDDMYSGDKSSNNPISSNSNIESNQEPPSIDNEITYDANGGEYITLDGYVRNKAIYSTAHHPRPNTSIGTDIMKRDGYILNGWNTKRDGSGLHIGLGSRYLNEENDSFTLYAEWEKQSDETLFSVKNVSDGCQIIKYKGDENRVVVPETINDKKVVSIASKAFNDKTSKTVILSSSINEIEEEAFYDCDIEELYFYDNLTKVSDASFAYCDNLATVHINAINAPRYSASDRHSTYADKIDTLYLLRNKKKIVIMGGSGAYYNIDACRLHEIDETYETVNVAINGWFNAQMQFEIIENYIGQNDILIHSVESCGEYQFMKRNDMGNLQDNDQFDCRYFNCLELNYDLISLANITHVSRFFDVYATYNQSRLTKDPSTYYAYTSFADERGDYSKDPEIRKKYTGEAGSISQEGEIDPNSHSDDGLNELLSYYQNLQDKGASIYFAYSPVNADSLSIEEKNNENLYRFFSPIETAFSNKVEIINNIFDVIYPYTYFADSDWHLDYEHAIMFTDLIANGIHLI